MIIEIGALKEYYPGRLMGLDIGDKTIGISLSDEEWNLASPLEIIDRKGAKTDIPKLLILSQKHAIRGFVAGLPKNLDGSEGLQAQKTRRFTEELANKTDLPIAFWDERLSTQAVERIMIHADLSRKKRKEVIDRAAASYILQGALDFLNRL